MLVIVALAIGGRVPAESLVCPLPDADGVDAFAPATSSPPSVAVWSDENADPRTGCDGIGFASAKLAVVMRGNFRFGGDVDGLLGRLGAISTLTDVRYWSVTDEKWLGLISQAYALRGASTEERRGDFSAAELKQGKPVYYLQRDNRSSGPVIYRMHVDVRGPYDAVADIENDTAVQYVIITLFPPGALRTHIHLRRVAPGIWQALLIDRVGTDVSILAMGHAKSYVNRTAAIFRHIAGIPSDLNPPMAR